MSKEVTIKNIMRRQVSHYLSICITVCRKVTAVAYAL